MGGHTGHSPVEMSVAHVRGSQRIISEKSTKFPTEKLIIFKKNRRERRFFCVDQFSFTRRNGTVPERRHLLGWRWWQYRSWIIGIADGALSVIVTGNNSPDTCTGCRVFCILFNEEWFTVYNEYVNMDNDRGTNCDNQREDVCASERKEHDAHGALWQNGHRSEYDQRLKKRRIPLWIGSGSWHFARSLRSALWTLDG